MIEKELRRLGLDPGKGQNFLTHQPTIEALAEAGEIEGSVLEIGGGLGSITSHLLEKTSDLTVIENEALLADHLREKFPEADVVEGDVLQQDLSGFDRCVSNIPFQLSSEIIVKLGENQVQSALIVQEALADKIVADPGEKKHGFFTVKAQYYFLPVKLRPVDSSMFYPEPEVDAAIIKLYPGKHRHEIEDEEEFFSVVKALHTHGKKKLRNAFVDARNMLGTDKDEAKALRDDLPHRDKRVRELGIQELKQVFEFYQENI
ncbi:MAG: rRNA adenine N-6-methyltransferase family protein [Candidatus Nanohaloarchaea archaeon]